MLNIKIRSYDEHFDTYHISVQEQDMNLEEPIESLIPAILLPYIAPNLVAMLDDLPFDAVGQEFNLPSTGGSI